MSIPILMLLGFAAWTLLTLFASIGVYRWSRILTGAPRSLHGGPTYRRAATGISAPCVRT
jgi:hypothetical protein